MAHLSTGGLQDINRSDGSGAGCSLTDAQRARPLPDRPTLTVEPRVFCLRCAWSAPLNSAGLQGFGDHLAAHPGAGAVDGVDFATGHCYGPLGGIRPRGKACPLPPLRRRSGKAPETAGRAARAAEASRRARRRLARERAAAGNAPEGAAVE